MKYEFIEKIGNYTFWKYNGVYNCTKGYDLPKFTGGYYNLNELIKIKKRVLL